MTVYNGYNGYFQIGASGATGTIANMAHWTLTVAADANDVTVFGNIWRDFKSGCVAWTASGDGFWDGSASQTGAHALLVAGTLCQAYFYVNTTNGYSGKGYLTGKTVDTPVAGVVAISFDFQGTGTLATS